MARFILYEHEGTEKRKRVKEGFRWLCFAFGPFWFFAHGMIGKGLLWFIAALILAPFTFGIGTVVLWIIAGFVASSAEQKELASSGWKCLGYEDDLIVNASKKANSASGNISNVELEQHDQTKDGTESENDQQFQHKDNASLSEKPHIVCPFCGAIAKPSQKQCTSCWKTFPKDIEIKIPAEA